ncbi:MAG: hypothetical protein KDJ41_13445 [Hyphomicrobiaceae bacterium]|nr:hypothetical protein [Hyphomicrobiaceae bacterium]
MVRVVGALLLFMGIGVAVFAFPKTDTAQKAKLDTLVSIATQRDVAPTEPAAARQSAPRIFSPAQPLLRAQAPASAPIVRPQPAAPRTVAAEVPRAPRVQPSESIPTSIVPARPATPALVQPRLQSPPERHRTAAALARDIQSELKRVGCYHGDIDGVWGPGSKRAMAAFVSRANASLPVDQPDHILLTLVRGFKTTACGTCRSNEVVDNTGRCRPRTTIARGRPVIRDGSWQPSVEPAAPRVAQARPAPVEQPASSTPAAAEPAAQPPRARRYPYGRMALGVDPATQPRPARIVRPEARVRPDTSMQPRRRAYSPTMYVGRPSTTKRRAPRKLFTGKRAREAFWRRLHSEGS